MIGGIMNAFAALFHGGQQAAPRLRMNFNDNPMRLPMSKISDERLDDLVKRLRLRSGTRRFLVTQATALEAADTIEALRSGGEEKNGVGVKPLEWHGPDMHGEIHARSVLCVYSILSKQPNGHWLTEVGGYHPSIEAAKAAAQADYERRIRSALTNTDLSLRAENERLNRDQNAMQAELDHVSAAIGSVRWMDPPDGGSVSLGEQVKRMRLDLEAAEAKLEEAAKAINALPRYVLENQANNGDVFVSLRKVLANLKGAE